METNDALWAKFTSKVDKTPGLGPKGDCWEWRGRVNEHGYGLMYKNGVERRAHRISYELYKGEIPAGLLVCHKCDNRLCVKPFHLSPGSHAENTQDMLAKGRHAEQRRTHCPKGHALVEGNLVRCMKQRRCLTCHRICVNESGRKARAAKKLLQAQ